MQWFLLRLVFIILHMISTTSHRQGMKLTEPCASKSLSFTVSSLLGGFVPVPHLLKLVCAPVHLSLHLGNWSPGGAPGHIVLEKGVHHFL